jgi:hypothetical protein
MVATMEVEMIPGGKTWGVIPHPKHEGHFHTGWEHERIGGWVDGYLLSSKMEMGKNAIMTGDFCVDTFTRGRSATGVSGHFRDHKGVSYVISLDGIAKVFNMIQQGKFIVNDGYFSSRWTFIKQGQSIFITPHEVK